MIYTNENVALDTVITDVITNNDLHTVVSIDTASNCLYLYDSPPKWCIVTGEIDSSKIQCEWIDVYYNEQNIPDRFIFKRLTDAQP